MTYPVSSNYSQSYVPNELFNYSSGLQSYTGTTVPINSKSYAGDQYYAASKAAEAKSEECMSTAAKVGIAAATVVAVATAAYFLKNPAAAGQVLTKAKDLVGKGVDAVKGFFGKAAGEADEVVKTSSIPTDPTNSLLIKCQDMWKNGYPQS